MATVFETTIEGAQAHNIPSLAAPSQPATLSIVIPAYNEQFRLPKSLQKIDEYLKGRGWSAEIIVVNDGSTDSTLKVLQDISLQSSFLRVLSYDRNVGKGFAVRSGVLVAKSELILLCDADLSTPIEEVDRLRAALIEGHDIVIGSRYSARSSQLVVQPISRRIIGRTFSAIVSIIGVRGFKDTQCGFKLFRRSSVQRVFVPMKTRGFSFDVELLLRGKSANLRILELPVRWIADPDSRVRPIRDASRMILELLWMRGFL